MLMDIHESIAESDEYYQTFLTPITFYVFLVLR